MKTITDEQAEQIGKWFDEMDQIVGSWQIAESYGWTQYYELRDRIRAAIAGAESLPVHNSFNGRVLSELEDGLKEWRKNGTYTAMNDVLNSIYVLLRNNVKP